MSLPDCEAATFAVCSKSERLGTAVAIHSNLLITCSHVVKGRKKVALVSHHPVFEESKSTKVEVAGIDENRDLALLRSRVHLPFLQLEKTETLDDSTPLIVWSWPGWNALEENVEDESGPDLRPAPHLAVRTDSWAKNSISRFSFAGHAEVGMSGGVVVSALTRKIVGVITDGWNIDPDEVAETWWESYGCQQDHDPEKVKAIRAQLDLGMGIALSVKELRAFLDSKAPGVL